MLKCIDTGLVYRNPKPHLRSIHTWHPSLALLEGGEIVGSLEMGEAVEALNYRAYVTRSVDEGKSWTEPAPILRNVGGDPGRRSTHSMRITRIGSELIGVGGRYYRDDAEGQLTNRDNLGFVPMDLIMSRSRDQGRTWDDPVTIKPPLVGPGFEVCHKVVELRDGRWLYPTSTWRGWNGEQPNGMKAVAFVSHDKGHTWPEYIDIMDRTSDGIICWEQGFVELPDGRLLATMWWYNERTSKAEPTPYAIYSGGKKFSEPKPTGLQGETAKLICLRDGRVLCLYRRLDKPGLWANQSKIEGDTWVNLAEAPVWTGAATGIAGEGNASDRLSNLKLGFPSMVQLANGDVFAVFWCREDCIHNIRWARISL